MRSMIYIWTAFLAVLLSYSGLAIAKKPDSSNCPCYQDIESIVDGIEDTTCITDILFEHSVDPINDSVSRIWKFHTESSAFCGSLAIFELDSVKSCSTSSGHMFLGALCTDESVLGFDGLTDDEYRNCLAAAKEAKRQLSQDAMCELP